MLTRDVIQALQVFLARVDLKGGEVPAFNRVMAQLAEAEKNLTERSVVSMNSEGSAARSRAQVEGVPTSSAG